MSDRRRPRALLVFLLSASTLFVVALGAWLVGGSEWIERMWLAREGAVYRFFEDRGLLVARNLPVTLRRVGRFVEESLALWGAGLGLVAVVYAFLRLRPGWVLGPLLVIGWWFAVETLAAPFLVRRFVLNHYEYVRNPDHWPEGVSAAPGWNADGLAQDREASDYREEDYVILFLGDSFTYGYRLAKPHVDAFPHVVERRLQARYGRSSIRVANFGWTSASPLLSRRRLEAIGAEYHPDRVVLCIDMTDPRDDIWYRELIERNGLCAWFDRLPLTIRMWKDWAPESYRRVFEWSLDGRLPYLRYFACEAPLDETRAQLEPMAENIRDCARVARAMGCEFEVFVLPRYFQYTDEECPEDREQERPFSAHSVLGPYSTAPFEWFEQEFAPTVDFPVHSLLPAFAQSEDGPHCYPDDAHWTRLGHQIAGAAIARQLSRSLDRTLAEHEAEHE